EDLRRAKHKKQPIIDEDLTECDDDPISMLLTILPRLRKRPVYIDKLSVKQEKSEVYGFIEPQSIQKSGNTK
ncbi:unnamed protein product, partial [Sphenostylis stenocarpa]